MVFGSGFPVPTVLNPIYGLWVWFPCLPTVLNPIYGLWVRFQSHIWSLGPVSLSHCVESHIWSLGSVSIPYMVFGSGFNPIYAVSLSHCVESYGLWVRFPCPTVLNPIYGLWVRFQSHIWSLDPVSPRVSLSQLC